MEYRKCDRLDDLMLILNHVCYIEQGCVQEINTRSVRRSTHYYHGDMLIYTSDENDTFKSE